MNNYFLVEKDRVFIYRPHSGKYMNLSGRVAIKNSEFIFNGVKYFEIVIGFDIITEDRNDFKFNTRIENRINITTTEDHLISFTENKIESLLEK